MNSKRVLFAHGENKIKLEAHQPRKLTQNKQYNIPIRNTTAKERCQLCSGKNSTELGLRNMTRNTTTM